MLLQQNITFIIVATTLSSLCCSSLLAFGAIVDERHPVHYGIDYWKLIVIAHIPVSKWNGYTAEL